MNKLRLLVFLVFLLFLAGCTESVSGQANRATSPPNQNLPSNTFLKRPVYEHAEMVITNISIPTPPLQKGRYSFPITRFNKGPSKCCETKTESIIYRNGQSPKAMGTFETEACLFDRNSGGFMPGETRTNMGTMSYNYNETGTYRITAKIQCNAPLTIPRLSKEYTVEIQII